MADLGTSTTTGSSRASADGADTGGRRVTRRRTLPGGRVVVGALLITLAILGVFAAWLSATAAPTTSWVVASVPLRPGDQVGLGDVELVPMDLPEAQGARVVPSVEAAVGAVLLAPVEPGDPLLRSVVRPPEIVPGSSAFSLELPASQALAGAVAGGDRVDVVATEDGRTRFVAADVAVVDATTDGGTVVVILALAEPELVLAVAHAVDEGSVHLARSNRDQPAGAGEAVEPDEAAPTPSEAGTDPTVDGDGGTG